MKKISFNTIAEKCFNFLNEISVKHVIILTQGGHNCEYNVYLENFVTEIWMSTKMILLEKC